MCACVLTYVCKHMRATGYKAAHFNHSRLSSAPLAESHTLTLGVLECDSVIRVSVHKPCMVRSLRHAWIRRSQDTRTFLTCHWDAMLKMACSFVIFYNADQGRTLICKQPPNYWCFVSFVGLFVCLLDSAWKSGAWKKPTNWTSQMFWSFWNQRSEKKLLLLLRNGFPCKSKTSS